MDLTLRTMTNSIVASTPAVTTIMPTSTGPSNSIHAAGPNDAARPDRSVRMDITPNSIMAMPQKPAPSLKKEKGVNKRGMAGLAIKVTVLVFEAALATTHRRCTAGSAPDQNFFGPQLALSKNLRQKEHKPET